MPEMNRRSFLVSAVTAAAVISLPVLQTMAADAPADAGPPTDVGPVKQFTKDGVTDTWAKTKKFFIVRQDKKIYACTTLCTHRGVQLTVKGNEFYCPKHKSEFTFQGTVTGGPAKRSLPRFAVKVDDKGHLIVDTGKSFAEKEWDDAGASVDAV